MTPWLQRIVGIRLPALALMSLLLVACAQLPPQLDPLPAGSPSWRGRLALKIDAAPPQSFTADFELSGRAQHGELFLYSPLGQTLSRLRWVPGTAWLEGNGRPQRFDSLDELAYQATGADLPIAALFDWLDGRTADADGWQADLSEIAQGRLTAQRQHPAPAVRLRIILEP